jgi:hypothetical protein
LNTFLAFLFLLLAGMCNADAASFATCGERKLLYDPSSQQCREGAIYPAGWELCLKDNKTSSPYNPADQQCFEGVIYRIGLERCPADQKPFNPYSPATHTCFERTVYPIGMERCHVPNSSRWTLYDPKFMKCFEGGTFSNKLEVCRYTNGSGWTVYDPLRSWCNAGRVVEGASPTTNDGKATSAPADQREFATFVGAPAVQNSLIADIKSTAADDAMNKFLNAKCEAISNYHVIWYNEKPLPKNWDDNRPKPYKEAADCSKGMPITYATTIKGISTLEKMTVAENALSQFPVLEIFNPVKNPHQYLLFIVTDGTGNMGEQFIGPEGVESGRYARESCLDKIRGFQSNNYFKNVKLPSNPRILFNQVALAGQKNVRTIYVRGVGTTPNRLIFDVWDQVTGGADLAAQVNAAMLEAEAVISEVKRGDSQAEFVFVTSGFSRGAAAARLLNNRIFDDGLRDMKKTVILDKRSFIGEIIDNAVDVSTFIAPQVAAVTGLPDLWKTITDSTHVPTGQINIGKRQANIGATVLFDTVVSLHLKGNEHGMLLKVKENLKIPQVIPQALHIVAENEYRAEFQLTPIEGAKKLIYGPKNASVQEGEDQRNLLEIPMPGAHSDIGGTYTTDGISAVTLRMTINYLNRLGIKTAPLHSLYEPNVANYVIHDSRYCPELPFLEQLEVTRGNEEL